MLYSWITLQCLNCTTSTASCKNFTVSPTLYITELSFFTATLTHACEDFHMPKWTPAKCLMVAYFWCYPSEKCYSDKITDFMMHICLYQTNQCWRIYNTSFHYHMHITNQLIHCSFHQYIWQYFISWHGILLYFQVSLLKHWWGAHVHAPSVTKVSPIIIRSRRLM